MSATESVLEKMRLVLDELDGQGQMVAAAYLAHAISMIERQAATDGTGRV